MASLLHRAARKLVRGPLALYDRLLGGRAFPGAAIDRRVARLQTWAGGGTVPLSRERWDREYDGGVWDYLAGDEEATRYRAIVELIRETTPAAAGGTAEGNSSEAAPESSLGSILDVGCGEGVLVDFLPRAGSSTGPSSGSSSGSGRPLYRGLDLSARAIEVAEARRGDERTRFVVADAETWAPAGGPSEAGERFDAIVLNECLYYFHEPLATLDRYLAVLAPGGVLVVSMYEAPRTIALARALDRHLPPLRSVRLAGPPGAWRISVHRRSDAAAQGDQIP